MNRPKLISAISGIALFLFLSCSDNMKPVERETLEEYESRLSQSSSSAVASSASSSSEGAGLSSSSNAGSSSSGEGTDQSSSGEEQKASVSGFSQKGPFLNNSSIMLYELDSNLTQTGNVFQGMTDDKGSFEIKGVELASSYALLKADGYYRNEVSGENSGPITLYAIADMGSKSSANVNILTHLEYYRVQNLVKGGKSITQAKRQALSEILAVFGIDGSGFGSSEEMSIFGTGDGAAALLAISILLQSNLSEGSFMALLGDFSQKLVGSGTWDNKARMAVWASSADLTAIRGNILGWGLSPDVPNFEKYITGYVVANSGDCSVLAENQFCYGEIAYDKCGDANGNGSHEYNPVSQFCHNNCTVSKCGGKEYIPLEEECKAGVVGKLCGTNWYDPLKDYCHDNQLYACGGKPYNPVTQFCHGLAAIHDKCNGSEYEPSTHFCLGTAITPLCGGKTFTASQFCSANAIYDKCGGTATYAPNTEACCGSGKYATATQFCHGGSKVGAKCGTRTETFDPDLYECRNTSKIYLKTPVSYAGDSYNAVLIGTQTWMAKDLNYNASGSKCHSDSQSNCGTYGRLYNWATAMNNASASNAVPSGVQGICPAGWHLPSGAEWTILANYIGTDGRKLKTTSGWIHLEAGKDGNGTDDYGFSALPGGYYYPEHNGFSNVGNCSHWFGTNLNNKGYPYHKYVCYHEHNADYAVDSSFFSSVRCVKD